MYINTEETLQENMGILIKQLKDLNVDCNTDQTKTMIVGNENVKHNIKKKDLE